jgi:hypothetical protein
MARARARSKEPIYRGAKKRLHSLAEVLEHAERLAPRLAFTQLVLDLLYANRRCSSISHAEWEQDVRLATAMDDCFRRLRPLENTIDQIADFETRSAAIQNLTSPRAALALCYHGGFPYFRMRLFGHLFPQSVSIASTGKHAAHDGAFALFAAREALLKGLPVLIAPDGRFGKETGSITVLGAKRAITDGAPFLAYSTGCSTAWFDVVRTGRGFAIDIVPGPCREDHESFGHFRDRFYKFYAERIESCLTGDPRNLAINESWGRTFEMMLAGAVDGYRRGRR